VYTGAFTYASQYKSAGVHTLVYTNFFRCYSTDSPSICYTDLKPGGKYASAEAMDSACTGPAYDSHYGGGYQNDPRNSTAALVAEDRVKVDPYSPSQDIDAVISDDTGASGGLTNGICSYASSTWLSATNTLHSTVAAALGIKLFVNAIDAWATNLTPVQLAQTSQPAAVLGAMAEGAFVNGSGVKTGSAWANEENAAIATQNNGKIFWALPNNTTTASSAQALRTYSYASFLLTFNPNQSMYQDGYGTPSHFSVMPETGLVPMDPATTATGTITTYALAGGGYERTWADCYYNGSYLGGGCAVVINPTSATIAVPPGYMHSLVMNGGGLYEGGTVSFNGPTIGTLAPGTAAILFQ
jgi:hypothetical protein